METSKRIEIINAEYSARYAEITSRRMKTEQLYKAQLNELQDANAKAVRELQDSRNKDLLLFAEEVKQLQAKKLARLQECTES